MRLGLCGISMPADKIYEPHLSANAPREHSPGRYTKKGVEREVLHQGWLGELSEPIKSIYRMFLSSLFTYTYGELLSQDLKLVNPIS